MLKPFISQGNHLGQYGAIHVYKFDLIVSLYLNVSMVCHVVALFMSTELPVIFFNWKDFEYYFLGKFHLPIGNLIVSISSVVRILK
jgi:hypothetical protein